MTSATTVLPYVTSFNTCDDVTDPLCANSTGTGNSTATSDGRNENLARFEVFVSGLIFACAVIGNSVVLSILGTRRKKLSRMNLMIVHLSIADLFVAFFNVLPQLVWDITYRFAVPSDFVCRLVKYFQVVAMYASSYVLVSTAIDRYLAICHPLIAQTWTTRKTHSLVGTAWLFSLLFSAPQIHIFGYRQVSLEVYDCWAVWDFTWSIPVYVTWFTVAIYVIPFIILVIAYGRICLIVWRSVMSKEPSMREGKAAWKKHGSNGEENGSVKVSSNGVKSSSNGSHKVAQLQQSRPRAHVGSMSRAKVKTIKLTLVVIICYLTCWGPFFFVQLWAAWDINAPFDGNAFVIIMLLASLNSCTNPWIYLMFSDSLYRQLSRCFRGKRLYDRSVTSESDSRWRSTRFSTMSTTEAPRTIHLRPLTSAGETKF